MSYNHISGNTLIYILLCKCSQWNEMTTTFNVYSVGSDYIVNTTAIEQKRQEMLAIADRVGNFWFSDDSVNRTLQVMWSLF